MKRKRNIINSFPTIDSNKRARAEPLRYARSTELPVHAVYPDAGENNSSGIDFITKSYTNDAIVNVHQVLPTYETPKPPSKCETPGCIEAATKIINYIDESLDPCENFYQFACGTYLKNTPIPADKVTVDAFSNVRDLVEEQLRIVLNEPPQPNDTKPYLLAKYFHSSCLNQEIIEGRGIKPLADILEAFGGWPVLKGDLWSDDSFNWIETIKKFRRMGFDTYVIFAFSAETNLKNSSERVLVVS